MSNEMKLLVKWAELWLEFPGPLAGCGVMDEWLAKANTLCVESQRFVRLNTK